MIQLQVLNKILKNKDSSLIISNNLTKEYFSDYVDEFNFINDYMNQYNYKIPDVLSFKDKFPDFSIVDVNDDDNYLIKELVEDKNKRFLTKTFNKVKKLLETGDVDGAKNLFITESSNITSNSVALKTVNLIKDTSRYDRYMDKLKYKGNYYISTGFKELDDIIGGWDRTEELATIVARTNVGKTWILLKSAVEAAKQGFKVGIYSGEMSEDKIGYRIDTLIGHISNGALTHGNVSVQEDYEQYIKNISNTVKGEIIVVTPSMINGPAGVSALRTFINKEKLDILFVDQHSLLEDDRGAKNFVERASNISKDLKNLQVMEHIPIIAVSQQNRVKNEDGSVDASQISQSDRIGQDSTCVIFVIKEEGVLKLNLVKSRDSNNGQVLTYMVDLNTGDFTYVPTEADGGEVQFELNNESSSVTGEEVF